MRLRGLKENRAVCIVRQGELFDFSGGLQSDLSRKLVRNETSVRLQFPAGNVTLTSVPDEGEDFISKLPPKDSARSRIA